MTTTPLPAAATREVGDCCEPLPLSRRGLLRGAAALAGTAVATSVFGTTVVQSSYAATALPAGAPLLVVVSLRGAADGLSLVVPHADPGYYRARPRLGIPRASLLVPDAQFGLHPAFAPLLPLWQAGKVAAVHATGLPAPNRSHFAAMEELEDADPGSSTRSGWLNRLVAGMGAQHPLRALQMGDVRLPTSLAGPAPAFAVPAVQDVQLAGTGALLDAQAASLAATWATAKGPLGAAGRGALDVVRTFRPVRESPPRPAGSPPYPRGDLGRALASAARTMKAPVGTQVVTVDHGGWDLHVGAGTVAAGRQTEQVGELARALATFVADLGALADRTTIVVLTEFGRRVVENGGGGTDHGHGGVMLVVGAGVKGGYHGRWQALATTPDADVPVTTDYRSVLAEVAVRRFGASSASVFPGFSPQRLGVMV